MYVRVLCYVRMHVLKIDLSLRASGLFSSPPLYFLPIPDCPRKKERGYYYYILMRKNTRSTSFTCLLVCLKNQTRQAAAIGFLDSHSIYSYRDRTLFIFSLPDAASSISQDAWLRLG